MAEPLPAGVRGFATAAVALLLLLFVLRLVRMTVRRDYCAPTLPCLDVYNALFKGVRRLHLLTMPG